MRRLLLLLGCVLISFRVNAADIEVFYSSLSGQSVDKQELVNHTAQYHDLDAGRIAQQKINKLVAGTKREAMKRFSTLQNMPEGQRLVKAVADGYQSVGRAFQLELSRLPAIVFNGRYVVYGTTDIRVALMEYEVHEK